MPRRKPLYELGVRALGQRAATAKRNLAALLRHEGDLLISGRRTPEEIRREVAALRNAIAEVNAELAGRDRMTPEPWRAASEGPSGLCSRTAPLEHSAAGADLPKDGER